MDDALKAALGSALGTPIRAAQRVTGGDINQAFRVALSDGRACFVKTHPCPPPGMFSAEATGLHWLRTPDGPRIPQVLAVADLQEDAHARGHAQAHASASIRGGTNVAGHPRAFLALELIESGARASDHDERLGRQLAALHRSGAPCFGLSRDNYIGVLPQHNRPTADWPTFYAERRLEPQLALARSAGRATRAMEQGFEYLFERLPDLCGPTEPPARLHGDLWGGNAMCDEAGQPVLFDPAVYGGHREIDLAMMRLFGGYSERVFQAYDEAYPLAAGADTRVALYQLYPLMVHVNLFGGGYGRQVEGILQQLSRRA